jgi:hypothetical protein
MDIVQPLILKQLVRDTGPSHVHHPRHGKTETSYPPVARSATAIEAFKQFKIVCVIHSVATLIGIDQRLYTGAP